MVLLVTLTKILFYTLFQKTTLNHIVASIFICLFTCIRCHAQLVTSSLSEIEQFGVQYAYQPRIIFPISKMESSQLEANLNYMGFTDIRKNVKSIRAALDYRIGKKNNGLQSTVGLLITNNYSGPFITKGRYYGHYQNVISISERTKCYAGAHIGLFNTQIKDNPSGVTGSVAAPDGNFSIGIEQQSWQIGLHTHQLFGNKYNSGTLIGQLKRYYSVRTQYNKLINNNIKVIAGVWYRMIADYTNDYYIDLTTYYSKVGFGIIYASQQQVSATLQLNDIGRHENWNINITSHIDIKINTLSRLGTFEIGLGYKLSNGSLMTAK